jgi:hypothetical protein
MASPSIPQVTFPPKPTKAVTVRALADMVNRHSTNVIRDLKKWGYKLVAIRTASGQKNHGLILPDLDRYLAERRTEGLPGNT